MKVRELIDVLKALPADNEVMVYDDDDEGNLVQIDFVETYRLGTTVCKCGHEANRHQWTPASPTKIGAIQGCMECSCTKYSQGELQVVRIW